MGSHNAATIVNEANQAVSVIADDGNLRLAVDAVTETNIARGLYSNASIIRGFGERGSMATTATGEDIWPGSATSIPIPAAAGEQMEVVSTSPQDGVAGTGIITMHVDYIDAAGDAQMREVTMNGTTPVVLPVSDVRFVQRIHAITVGSVGTAVGTITVYKQGSALTIYSMIAIGGNMALVPNRMVPAGKVCVVTHWHATESKNKRCAFRLRSTDEDGILRPGVFLFKDAMYLVNSALSVPTAFLAPALSIIKISGWPDASGSEASASWKGVLFDV